MKKPKLIIIEGPRGSGKTTISNMLREKIPYTNLLRLAGNPDKDDEGKAWRMYNALDKYILGIAPSGMNLVFDRTFISEYVFCKLGYKNYDFEIPFKARLYDLNTEISEAYDVHLVNLELNDAVEYARRLDSRGEKANYYDVKYDVENSMKQEEVYATIMGEIYEKCDNINLIHLCTADEGWEEKLFERLGIENE